MEVGFEYAYSGTLNNSFSEEGFVIFSFEDVTFIIFYVCRVLLLGDSRTTK